MLRHIEPDDGARALLGALGLTHAEPIVPAVADAEQETSLLPQDHPKWVKDTLTVSQRAKELIASIAPAIVRVLTFWDHRIRAIAIGSHRVSIDPSGSYRAE